MDQDPDDLAALVAEEIVAAQAPVVERLASLRRRLMTALYDAGLSDIVGRDWGRIGEGGIEFRPLSYKEAERLVRYLEGLGDRRTPGCGRVEGQVSLW